ncbi:MAG: NAD-dependent epimerase/dehydratase family protein [Ignavibacteria bacterium]
MKALVTGGAGFIGSNLVNLLLEKNFDVRIIDNLSTGYKKNIDTVGAEFIEGDIRDKDLMNKVTKDVNIIFHLAASIGNVKSLNNPQEDSEINVIGTLNVLESARKNNIEKIIYSSSAAIFGELVTMPISEEHSQNPDSPYGVSKLAAEKHLLCFGKLYDMTVVALRYFNVFGVNQRYDAYGNVIPIFANRLFTNQPLTIYGDGEQTRDFVNVKDVAMANFLAATKALKSNYYNIGSGVNITINKLSEIVQQASGINTGVHYEDARKGEVLHCRADISKIKNDLGFNPDTDIKKGLQEYFRWFKEDFEAALV